MHGRIGGRADMIEKGQPFSFAAIDATWRPW